MLIVLSNSAGTCFVCDKALLTEDQGNKIESCCDTPPPKNKRQGLHLHHHHGLADYLRHEEGHTGNQALHESLLSVQVAHKPCNKLLGQIESVCMHDLEEIDGILGKIHVKMNENATRPKLGMSWTDSGSSKDMDPGVPAWINGTGKSH